MDLFEQVSKGIIEAMKAKDAVRRDTLRNVKKVFLEAKTAPGSNDELKDADALKILQKLAKQGRESAEIYFNNNRYNDNLVVFGTNTNEFTIGLKKDVAVGSDWTCFVGWELEYYGTGADAYKYWAQDLVKNPRDVDNFVYYTTAVNDAYKAAVAGAANASTYDEVIAAANAIKQPYRNAVAIGASASAQVADSVAVGAPARVVKELLR